MWRRGSLCLLQMILMTIYSWWISLNSTRSPLVVGLVQNSTRVPAVRGVRLTTLQGRSQTNGSQNSACLESIVGIQTHGGLSCAEALRDVTRWAGSHWLTCNAPRQNWQVVLELVSRRDITTRWVSNTPIRLYFLCFHCPGIKWPNVSRIGFGYGEAMNTKP